MARDTSKYWIDGTRWPSPSDVLASTGYNAGMMEIPRDILQTAADRGTRTHDWCEQYTLGNPRTPDEDIALRCGAYLDFLDEVQPEILEVEEIVKSDRLRVIGQADIVARLDGKLAVIDIKTSAKVYRSHEVQTAMYGIAVEEMRGEQPDVYLLRLAKNGRYHLDQRGADRDFAAAESAAAVCWDLMDAGLFDPEAERE